MRLVMERIAQAVPSLFTGLCTGRTDASFRPDDAKILDLQLHKGIPIG